MTLRVDRGNRVLSFAKGELRVDDLHSRLRMPLPGGRAALLAPLFEMDEEILSSALRIAGDPAPEASGATLTAYLETEAPALRAFEAIASLEGYRRLLGGVADISGEQGTAAGFRLKLSAGGTDPGAAIEEEVAVEKEALRLSVARRGGKSESRSFYQAEEREGRTWLLREAALVGRPRRPAAQRLASRAPGRHPGARSSGVAEDALGRRRDAENVRRDPR